MTPRTLLRFLAVGSEVARQVAPALATVRRSNGMCGFPASRFHEDIHSGDAMKGNCLSGPSMHPSGQSRPPVSSDDDVRVFPKGTDPPHRPYSSGFPSLPSCLRPLPSPAHPCRRSLGHAAFTALQVLFSGPTTDRASPRHFAFAYRPAYSDASGDPASPPEVTRCSSVPCHPQTPWCGG